MHSLGLLDLLLLLLPPIVHDDVDDEPGLGERERRHVLELAQLQLRRCLLLAQRLLPYTRRRGRAGHAATPLDGLGPIRFKTVR